MTHYSFRKWLLVSGYAVFTAAIGALFLFVLLFARGRVRQMLSAPELEAGIFAFLGSALFAVHVPRLMMRPKPSPWTYDLILIGLGLSSCLVVACIPLLSYWIKPETKRGFGRSDV